MEIQYTTTGYHISDTQRAEIAVTYCTNDPNGGHSHTAFVFVENIKVAALPYDNVMKTCIWKEVSRLLSQKSAVLILVDLNKNEYKVGRINEKFNKDYSFGGYVLKMGVAVSF